MDKWWMIERDWMDGWMDDRWIDEWIKKMNGWMDGWMNGWITKWIMDGWMNGWWMDRQTDEWKGEWMDEWMDGWMNGKMNGCIDIRQIDYGKINIVGDWIDKLRPEFLIFKTIQNQFLYKCLIHSLPMQKRIETLGKIAEIIVSNLKKAMTKVTRSIPALES